MISDTTNADASAASRGTDMNRREFLKAAATAAALPVAAALPQTSQLSHEYRATFSSRTTTRHPFQQFQDAPATAPSVAQSQFHPDGQRVATHNAAPNRVGR